MNAIRITTDAMSGWDLRAKRMAAGISGSAICQKIGRSRSWLTGIERGYIKRPTEELQGIAAAIDEVIQARQHVARAAAEAGVSLVGVVSTPDAFALRTGRGSRRCANGGSAS